jgi:hypothetical protein
VCARIHLHVHLPGVYADLDTHSNSNPDSYGDGYTDGNSDCDCYSDIYADDYAMCRKMFTDAEAAPDSPPASIAFVNGKANHCSTSIRSSTRSDHTSCCRAAVCSMFDRVEVA